MEIKKKQVLRDSYELECMDCGKKIVGTSESHVLYNFNLHHATHKKIDGETDGDNPSSAVETPKALEELKE